MIEITRYPHTAGLKRGANMLTRFCQKCYKQCTHGFDFSDTATEVLVNSFFVCDDCLKDAKNKA